MAVRSARQRCQYDCHGIKPPIAARHRNYMHELFDIAIDFCNLGLRKPAGFAQCPQFSVRTCHGCVRSLKAVAEIANTQSQHRGNNRIYLTSIAFSPEFVAEAQLWSNGAKEGFAASILPVGSSASHKAY